MAINETPKRRMFFMTESPNPAAAYLVRAIQLGPAGAVSARRARKIDIISGAFS
jgi:hypothetical protein